MSRRTKKVGIVGKYGTRYGSTLRKRIKPYEESQRSKYECNACGKMRVRREVVGIWKCRACSYTFAGGAYVPATIASTHIKSTIKRLCEIKK
ncbi:ribosomal protein L37a [Edhazardia aedis USNM 41457]|uniref:Ribosomal protein L37a n=1 Tax=Edhazardia aedis (strain USNM 41457) TaxID=1003232 RepID=J9DJT4_EDHAE|nr:ribosomal protein L37a [Edhazardia aedis USNM 41457]|eukprot:EJW01602.1 ribosomal protein L37a [Edhazardia aedis USNM 41457]